MPKKDRTPTAPPSSEPASDPAPPASSEPPPSSEAAPASSEPPPPSSEAPAPPPVTAPKLEAATRDPEPATVVDLAASRRLRAFGSGEGSPSAFFDHAIPAKPPAPPPAPPPASVSPPVEVAQPPASVPPPAPPDYGPGIHVAVPVGAATPHGAQGGTVQPPAAALPRRNIAAPAMPPPEAIRADLVSRVHVARGGFAQLVNTPGGPMVHSGDGLTRPPESASGAASYPSGPRSEGGVNLPEAAQGPAPAAPAAPAALVTGAPAAAPIRDEPPAAPADPKQAIVATVQRFDDAIQAQGMAIQRYALTLPADHPDRDELMGRAADLREGVGRLVACVNRHAGTA